MADAAVPPVDPLEPVDGLNPFDLAPSGRPDFDTGYLRCPGCGVIATPATVDYPVTPDGRLADGRPIEVTCTFDGHRHQVTAAAFLPRDAVAGCRRPGCAATFPVPTAADEVVCPACRLHQDGPGLDDQKRRDHVGQVYSAHAAALRARLGHR
ncbi:MAG TPA: hypothetical protein VI248_02130 [Kineosporiaceae bacterium]